MALDVDKVDENIRYAMGIVDLLMDNIAHRVDSNPESMEYALCAAKKNLEEALNEIYRDTDERMAKILSGLDDNPFEDDEEADEEPEEDPFK